MTVRRTAHTLVRCPANVVMVRVSAGMGSPASNGLGFWSGLMRGLAASLEVYEPLKPLEPRSQEQTMRGDWTRIGEDFKVVIARVNGRADQR